MFGFIFGIILMLAGIITCIAMIVYDRDNAGAAVGILLAGIIVGGISIFFGCTASVPTGHTGVVTVFGRVEDKTFEAGFHTKAPWESVQKIDNRVQRATIELSCFSSDLQEVSCKYVVAYQINKKNAPELYKTIGLAYYDTAIDPATAESVKTIMAHYTAEELIGNRDNLAKEIETMLGEQLAQYNIELVSTAIADLDFTDAFTNAVEAKQVAQQNKLKAEIEQAQAVKQAEADAVVAQTKAEADASISKIKAEADAEIAKIQAQADLEATKIQADAAEYAGQKEAAKNKAINESLSGDLLNYYYLQQWDGKLPETYIGSENVSTIVGLEK